MVGFLYTAVDKVLSGLGVTGVSRKGMDSSGIVSSVLTGYEGPWTGYPPGTDFCVL